MAFASQDIAVGAQILKIVVYVGMSDRTALLVRFKVALHQPAHGTRGDPLEACFGQLDYILTVPDLTG